MFLRQTTKYALNVLVEMAEDPENIYSAHYLHKKLDIPERYLMRILTDLSKYGFIKSSLGRNGGFRFKKSPDKIFLSDVIDSIEGLESYKSCFFGIEHCKAREKGKCALHDPWMNSLDGVFKVLSETTLTSLHNGKSNIKV